MPVAGGLIIVAIVGVASLLIFGIWGLPVVIILLPAVLLYALVARRGDGGPVLSVERGRRVEPTGRPRQASGGADTANERVGQR